MLGTASRLGRERGTRPTMRWRPDQALSEQWRSEMLDVEADALAHELGYPAAVTMLVAALIAKEADAASLPRHCREHVKVLASLRCREMALIDAKQICKATAARGLPTLSRSAETA